LSQFLTAQEIIPRLDHLVVVVCCDVLTVQRSMRSQKRRRRCSRRS